MIRRLSILCLTVGLLTFPLTAAPGPTAVRVFHIQHCSVSEAAAAVEDLLTEDGSFTVQPGKSRITVQDRPDVVERVAVLIAELDQSPDRYLIEVVLLEGVQEELPLSQRAEVDDRVLRMFPFTSYRRIGATSVDGVAGDPAEANLGEGHLISFLAESVRIRSDTPYGIPDQGDRIHLEWLALVRLPENSEGNTRPIELLRASAFLSERQEVIIGAGASEDAGRGLVLILQARSIGGE